MADDGKLQRYGRHLAQECAACHRDQRTPDGPAPLAGYPADAFTATLEMYRSGARANPVMVSVARSLDAEQVKALAAYYASLPAPARR